MAGEWIQTRLGDHIILKGGLSYKGEFVDKGDALLIGMGCVSHTERFLRKGGRTYGGDFSDAHLVRPGDLVIATRQQSDNLPILGFPAMIPKELMGRDVIAATNLYKVTNHSEISNRFLFWLMRGTAYRDRILGCAKGTTVRMLTKDAIEDFYFLCPPKMERKAIAEALDALDDKIELNRRMNATLEGMARALFQSWFVDFDPVRAKLDGRKPEGMDKATAALFPDGFQESEAGPVPKGWEMKTVGDIGNVICGKTPATSVSDNYGNDIPFITIPDMHGNVFSAATARKLSHAGAKSQTNKTIPPGSLCVSCIATPGLVVITSEDSQTNQQINSVVPYQKEETYFWYWVMTGLGAEIAASGSGGSVLVNLSKGRFETLQVIKPPHEIISAYHNAMCPLFDAILANTYQSRTLATLRDTLLPKLLSGELNVASILKAKA